MFSLNDPDLDVESLIEGRYTAPDEACENEEMRKLIKDALGNLPEDQRMAIVLREYQDLSYDEIAAALNCSLGAVKSKIHRARQNIKDILVEMEVA